MKIALLHKAKGKFAYEAKRGFPCSIEKVLHCEISFPDLEKVLNLAKMYIKYRKSMEIPKFNRLLIQILFLHC